LAFFFTSDSQISRQNPDYVVEARETILLSVYLEAPADVCKSSLFKNWDTIQFNLVFTVVSFLNELFKSMF